MRLNKAQRSTNRTVILVIALVLSFVVFPFVHGPVSAGFVPKPGNVYVLNDLQLNPVSGEYEGETKLRYANKPVDEVRSFLLRHDEVCKVTVAYQLLDPSFPMTQAGGEWYVSNEMFLEYPYPPVARLTGIFADPGLICPAQPVAEGNEEWYAPGWERDLSRSPVVVPYAEACHAGFYVFVTNDGGVWGHKLAVEYTTGGIWGCDAHVYWHQTRCYAVNDPLNPDELIWTPEYTIGVVLPEDDEEFTV